MFGYIQPLKPELKLKEYEAYKAYYCGLCKAIKENYTHTARFMLNYECATLALLLSSMSGEAPSVVQERCVASPFRKKAVIRSEAMAYAAAINILLGCAKLDDNVRDEGGFPARALRLIYRGVGSRARCGYEELAAVFAERLSLLFALERDGCRDIDAVADTFAHLLATVFAGAPFEFIDAAAKRALWHLGYNIGRWIYIADAVNDIEKDIKSGSYNVFLTRTSGSAAAVRQTIREEAAFNLNMSLAQAAKAYELLDIKRDKTLLDNIIYLGLAKKTQDVLKGETDGPV